jgi:hypothetical protein
MASQIIKVEAAEVTQWMTTSIYTDDDMLSRIHGVSPNSMPAIDHRHAPKLQSAQEDDSIHNIVVDNLQLPSIIPNYSHILIQGKCWQLRTLWPIYEFYTLETVLCFTRENNYLNNYVIKIMFCNPLISSRHYTVQDIHNE